jgi:hypothetical protein
MSISTAEMLPYPLPSEIVKAKAWLALLDEPGLTETTLMPVRAAGVVTFTVLLAAE